MNWSLGAGARTLWQEARGEPYEGQLAVSHVLVNRVHDGRWGQTLAEVCLSEFHGIFQFSGWDRNDPNRVAAMRLDDEDDALVALAALLQGALDGSSADITGGATHYYAASIVAPVWVRDATPCGKFGNQLFFKNVK